MAKFRPTQLLLMHISNPLRAPARSGTGRDDPPRAKRERVERLLHRGLVLLEPALGPERVGVLAPDVRIAVDGVRRDGEHRALGEEAAADGHAARGDNAREADARRGVHAERLVDDRLEVREALDGLEGRDGVVVISERGVKLLLELELHALVLREVVCDRA